MQGTKRVKDRMPVREQTFPWTFAGRSQCRVCHSQWVGESMSMPEEQLRQPAHADDDWRRLIRDGLLVNGDSNVPRSDDEFVPFSHLDDPLAATDVQARSYLHSNCAHCHMNDGNASTTFDLRFDHMLAETKAIDSVPMKGDYKLPESRIIAPGNPARSVLMYRMAKVGSGRMPHVGSQTVDFQGIRLLSRWISELPSNAELRNSIDNLSYRFHPQNDKTRLEAAEKLLGASEGSVHLASLIAEGRVPAHQIKDIVIWH